MTTCHSCNQIFEGYKELALHISASKKGHRKGKRWAAKYLHKNRIMNDKQFHPPTPLTEAQKQNRRDMIAHLSGVEEYVEAKCPNCKTKHKPILPIEFVESSFAWRINNLFVVLCPNCGR